MRRDKRERKGIKWWLLGEKEEEGGKKSNGI